MKKTILCLLSCLWIALSADATPIGKQKAQAIAHNFLTEKGVSVERLQSSAEGLTAISADGSRPYYVFNNGENKGFVIVSGDDRAPKVLGYSFTGSFQEENIPENLSAWLGNSIQHEAMKALYELKDKVFAIGDPKLIDDWRHLQTSDHPYYMCTKYFNDGDVHAYFSPYDSPFDAFLYYMNVMRDVRMRIDSHKKKPNLEVKGTTLAEK